MTVIKFPTKPDIEADFDHAQDLVLDMLSRASTTTVPLPTMLTAALCVIFKAVFDLAPDSKTARQIIEVSLQSAWNEHLKSGD